jgi:hypothetical protein
MIVLVSTQFDNRYRRSLALNLIKLPLFTLSRVIFNFFNFVVPSERKTHEKH